MLNQNLPNEEINSVILSLSIDCPNYCPNRGKIKNCILCEVCEFSITKKIKWLNGLSKNKKLEIFQQHEDCFLKKR